MAIWGHETVVVEKDVKARVWHVRTEAEALLVTIPWADAFKVFKHAPDYSEAIATCQSHPSTRLTAEEAAQVRAAAATPAPPAPPAAAPPKQELPSNVVAVDFKRRRRT